MYDASSTQRILIADDEPLYRKTTAQLLGKAGYECRCAADAGEALEYLGREPFDLILSDLNMPGNLKLELLRTGRAHWPDIPLIVVTGVPSLPTAIESIRLGIADYLLKPVKFEDLLASIRRVLAQPRPASPSELPTRIDPAVLKANYPDLIGRSEPMLEIIDIIERVAPTDTNVLLSGESGTGKEVVARAIHRRSHRGGGNFQVVDCTAIPESLFESVVFGHTKGSFTGADRDQKGLLSQCDGGTAFLDELGELPMPSQAKLLRAVQERSFTPVGAHAPAEIDTRYIGATNRDLQAEADAGRFRRDLFYRLGVIHLELPPLRQRGEDVVDLAEHFLEQLQGGRRRVESFSDEVLERFRQYDWPGNIRELRNVVERAVALTRSAEVRITDLPKPLREPRASGGGAVSVLAEISREAALDSADHSYLTALMEKHAGNISQAAQQAGLSRQGMHKLLNKHQITAADYRA